MFEIEEQYKRLILDKMSEKNLNFYSFGYIDNHLMKKKYSSNGGGSLHVIN